MPIQSDLLKFINQTRNTVKTLIYDYKGGQNPRPFYGVDKKPEKMNYNPKIENQKK